jgi:anti-anti-sigma factor
MRKGVMHMTRPSKHFSDGAARSPLDRPASPPLGIQTSYRFGVPLVYVSGELGHNSADQLRATIDLELAGQPRVLLLEFSQLVYIDSGGLALLFETAHKLKDKGWLGIVSPSPNVRRFAEIAGLFERSGFRVIEDLANVPAAVLEAGTESGPE